MKPLKVFLGIVEMRTKVVSMATFSSASLAAAVFLANNYIDFPWVNWFLMMAATLAVDMGTTGFNTYFDFIKGVDRIETNHEDGKVLVHDGVSPAQAFFTSLTLFFIAIILGLILTLRTSWLVAFIGFACMLVGFFYSAGPRPISHTPFGEVFSGLFLGSILFLITWFILTLKISLQPVLFSLPISLMISGILTVNNNCDLESDKEAGRKTVSIMLGLKAGRALLYIEYLAALLFLAVLQYGLNIYPRGFTVVSLLIVVIIIIQFILMERRGYSSLTKGPSMQSILNIFLLGSLLMIYPWVFTLFF